MDYVSRARRRYSMRTSDTAREHKRAKQGANCRCMGTKKPRSDNPMRKLFVALFVVPFILPRHGFAEPPSAGWNFGTDTYGQHDSQLILNSLSDRYGVSTFQTPTQSLGTDDYIQESAVKNQLAISGYSQAYDYNPKSQTGY